MPTVLIAGGTGLIGSRLSALLREKKYEVLHLSRRVKLDALYKTYQWDVEAQEMEEEAVEKADYIINLAGAGIVGGRWTARRKRLIIESRTKSAQLLQATMKRLGKKPKAYVSASAIGFYGDSGEQSVDETSAPGTGFLSESCIEWEASLKPLLESDIRTVLVRIGIVLSTKGGALEKMLIPFHFFAGVYFGNGQQWYSWIHIDDICGIFMAALENDQMRGIYNGVAPNPARNKELTVQTGRVWNRFALYLPGPAFALRLAMGEMADTILTSSKISADKVTNAGFQFRFPELPEALSDLYKRKV